MRIIAHKDFFKTPFHLELIGTQFKKTTDINGLLLGSKEFEEFAKVNLITIPPFPPPNYLKAYTGVLRMTSPHCVPWELCMPQEGYIKFLRAYGESLGSQLANADSTYYEKYYQMGNPILKELKSCKVDFEKLEEYENDYIVKTFKPNEDGFCEPPVFSRTETVSGRLKQISGPNILNLKKEYRNVIKSRFDYGQIFSLDYVSLEPRLILAINCLGSGTLPLEEIDREIYSGILSEVSKSGIEMNRSQIKSVVISELYGAGFSTLQELVSGMRENELKIVLSIVRNHFNLDRIKGKLIQEYELNNKKFIKNLYGRVISTEDVGSYALLNRFIQSTAVDVALIGFSNILKFIMEMNWQNEIIPLFDIHDALLFDIHPNHFQSVPTLCKIGSIEIPLLENQRFYLKAEEIK